MILLRTTSIIINQSPQSWDEGIEEVTAFLLSKKKQTQTIEN
jgi:hypothetical protein